VEKCCTGGQATDDNMAHAHCMLDNRGHKHTLRLCNTHYLSTATVVARMSLNITIYLHRLSCSECNFERSGQCNKALAHLGIFSVGGSTNSVQDRGQKERGYGGGSPLVSGSGGSCNLVQEISFHIVKFS
jgi:hypothetical protein